MNFYTITDDDVVEELGRRVKALRLHKNITQKQLASETELSLNVIKSLEAGRCKLSSLVSVLRALNALEDLHYILAGESYNSMNLARINGKSRERATGNRLMEKESNKQFGLAQ